MWISSGARNVRMHATRVLSTVALLAGSLGLAVLPDDAAGATVSSSPPTLVNSHANAHDYGPALMRDWNGGGYTDRHFWCGPLSNFEEGILYQDPVQGTRDLLPPSADSGPGAGWDHFFICDPSIVKGSFTWANTSYQYALYYTSNHTLIVAGEANAVGVAFSNNLIDWARTPAPVVEPEYYSTMHYGAGQQVAIRIPNTAAGVRLIYNDNSVNGQPHTYTITSTDGINFPLNTRVELPYAGLVTSTGESFIPTNADYGLDVADGYYYGVVTANRNQVGAPWIYKRGSSGDTYAYDVVRIRRSDLEAGTGQWTMLGQINSETTQGAMTYAPGILRDQFGFVDAWAPNLVVAGGTGPGIQYRDYTHADLSLTDVNSMAWSPGKTAYRRYYNGVDHYFTAAGITPYGYWSENQTYYLEQTPGVGRMPIYSCLVGTDHFTSADPACEGQMILGILGYSYTGPVAGSARLYRCFPGPGNENFMTTSANCEGWGTPTASNFGYVGTVSVAAGASDWTGDAAADSLVFRPSTGEWYINGYGNFTYGIPGDIPVPGDYDGNGARDIAVWRPSNGTWYINGVGIYQYGLTGDIPVPADYNGDGSDDIAVWRPSNGTWYIANQGLAIQYGLSDDIPVPGNWDSDLALEPAVWRPSTASWYINGSQTPFAYGVPGDVPLAFDHDGDGLDTPSVFRPSTGGWFVGGSYTPVTWGAATDIPQPVDRDAIRGDEISLWRPSDGTWYTAGGTAPQQWGWPDDVPMTASLNRATMQRLGLRP
jgi:hypothetical protein